MEIYIALVFNIFKDQDSASLINESCYLYTQLQHL